jgi:hypothetical protein
MTNVSTAYAPGKVLISVSCNGILDFEDQELAEKSKGTRALVWKTSRRLVAFEDL